MNTVIWWRLEKCRLKKTDFFPSNFNLYMAMHTNKQKGRSWNIHNKWNNHSSFLSYLLLLFSMMLFHRYTDSSFSLSFISPYFPFTFLFYIIRVLQSFSNCCKFNTLQFKCIVACRHRKGKNFSK